MTDRHALAEGLNEGTSRSLRLIAAAMGGAVLALAGVATWAALSPGAEPPSAGDVRLVNGLTTAIMGWTLVTVIAGEVLWRRALRRVENPAHADSAVRAGFIMRAALREGPAALGLGAVAFAGREGVLGAYPAYWVNAVPAALFLGFLAARWPTLDALRAEIVEKS